MSPSFFKILLDPSAPHMPLPPDFVTRHLGNRIPKDPILRSSKRGYSWRLKIKKIGECYCFEHGWNNVVKDIQLAFGDFLLFRLVDQSTFKILIYSPNGCEKDLPPKNKVENDAGSVDDDVVDDDDVEDVDDDDDDVVDDDEEEDVDDDDADDEEEEEEEDYEEEKEDGDDDDDDGGDIDGDDGDPFFTSVISKTHKNMLRLPAKFVELAGIDGEGTLTLKNLDGEEWQMGLRLEKSNQPKSYYFSTGWPDFRRSNDLSERDECVFKFIRSEGNLLLAKVTNKKRPAKQPLPADDIPATEVVKRKREQPQPNSSEISATEVVKRERGRPVREQDGGEDDCVEVVKRPRGRPPKRRRVRPAHQKSIVM